MVHNHSRPWFVRGALAVLATMLALALAMPALAVFAGDAPSANAAVVAAAPQWACEARPWLVGVRADPWQGDTGGIGSALPDGYVAIVSSDTVRREFRLLLYDGDDTLLTIPFAALATEPGTFFPTGRFDPQNLPVVTYHGGQVKIWVKLWQGGLARIYTWCGLVATGMPKPHLLPLGAGSASVQRQFGGASYGVSIASWRVSGDDPHSG